ncbi:hypothetical protein KFZ76_07565 [Methylovulum psychrotolerans]|jgi:hypothetical protein|uniref:hypothetical protein n=1 Tax=Methylovulum psychrotolerans TaxID=1704499 RepID=UPI001BFF3D77|nr:hypothetical protein [Methylovulum psychrotolerans]MBT9097563.1 hypothetical protein [Methylovulum psychrotolerans]
MKKTTLLLAAVAAFTALGQAKMANAHDITGSLGSAATAVDYYQVHCYDDGSGVTAHLYVAVINKSTNTPKVSVQAIRDNTATNTTDAVNGNATYSPGIYQPGTDGFFYLTVDKTGAGVANYSLQYHCQTSDQQHNGTDIFQLINQ